MKNKFLISLLLLTNFVAAMEAPKSEGEKGKNKKSCLKQVACNSSNENKIIEGASYFVNKRVSETIKYTVKYYTYSGELIETHYNVKRGQALCLDPKAKRAQPVSYGVVHYLYGYGFRASSTIKFRDKHGGLIRRYSIQKNEEGSVFIEVMNKNYPLKKILEDSSDFELDLSCMKRKDKDKVKHCVVNEGCFVQ